jgi:hypothetical protein
MLHGQNSQIVRRKLEVRNVEGQLKEVNATRRALTDQLDKRRALLSKLNAKCSERVRISDGLTAKLSQGRTVLIALKAHLRQLREDSVDLDSQISRSRSELVQASSERRRIQANRHLLIIEAQHLIKDAVPARMKIATSEILHRTQRLQVDARTQTSRRLRQHLIDEARGTEVAGDESDLCELSLLQVKQGKNRQRMYNSQAEHDASRYHHKATVFDTRTHSVLMSASRTEVDLDRAIVTLGRRQRTLQAHDGRCETMRVERDSMARTLADRELANKAIDDEIKGLTGAIATMKEKARACDETSLRLHIARRRIEDEIVDLDREASQIWWKRHQQMEASEATACDIVVKCHLDEQAALVINQQENLRNRIQESINSANIQLYKMHKLRNLLAERVRVSDSLVRISARQYEALDARVQVLEGELEKEIARRKELITQKRQLRSFQNEHCRLERLLIRAREECRCLEADAQKPRNVHRWTLLARTNPPQFELISLRMTLLEILEEQSCSSGRLTRIRSALDRKLAKLKSLLLKVPNCLFREEIAQTAQVLAEKTRQLQAMEQSCQVRKTSVDSRHRDVSSMKSRMREQLLECSDDRQISHESRWAEANEQQIRPPKSPPGRRAPGRFVGGGFVVGKLEMVREEATVELSKVRPKTSRTMAVILPASPRRGNGHSAPARPSSTRALWD